METGIANVYFKYSLETIKALKGSLKNEDREKADKFGADIIKCSWGLGEDLVGARNILYVFL